MAGNITFTMIKPDAVESLASGKILDIIINAGFNLRALKMVRLTKLNASKFYEIHKERPFYNSLVEFMSSGPVIAAILEKENAVETFRNFIGSTNPADAADGTIRRLFGTSMQNNAVHGSDSDENAIKEASFFFSEFERI
ncbi:MAG: nucleoside-diphosphate kinase [Omnitrophica WOR_2 bacterium]|jgi:nucleoside-diphosphate kinase